MIAQLKYGSGTPFYRLKQLERHLGIPLPAATQWEIVEEAAEVIQPARDELLRQAALGEVLHNDDTGMRVLRLACEPGDPRTGVFTSGIVATLQGRKIVLSRGNYQSVLRIEGGSRLLNVASRIEAILQCKTPLLFSAPVFRSQTLNMLLLLVTSLRNSSVLQSGTAAIS
jgi:hypothetical protein